MSHCEVLKTVLARLHGKCSAGRWSSRGAAVNDKTKEAHELVRALVGQIPQEGNIIVASDSRYKLLGDVRFEASKMKYVDI